MFIDKTKLNGWKSARTSGFRWSVSVLQGLHATLLSRMRNALRNETKTNKSTICELKDIEIECDSLEISHFSGMKDNNSMVLYEEHNVNT